MRVFHLGALGLNEQKWQAIEALVAAIPGATPRVRLIQTSGSASVRIFTTDAEPEIVIDNTFDSAGQDTLPSGQTLWEVLRGDAPLALQLEGLAPGELVLEVEFSLDSLQGSIVIHKDAVRLTVIRATLENPIDTNGDQKINDPAVAANDHTGNEFTFSPATPGVLTVPVRLRVEPDTEEVRALFEDRIRVRVDAINDSHAAQTNVQLGWDHAFSGESTAGNAVYDASDHKWKATVTFTTLPPDNDDFGKKTVTISLLHDDGRNFFEPWVDTEVFFPRDETNHPGGEPDSPNWYHYWRQVFQVRVHPNNNIVYHAAPAAWADVPGMTGWAYNILPNKEQIRVGPRACTKGRSYGVGEEASGIDRVISTLFHEEKHVEQIALADALMPASNGNDAFRYGWSWNQAAHNHWAVGPDGQWGQATVDDDNNGIVDDAAVSPPFEPGNGDDVTLDHAAWPQWPAAWALPGVFPRLHPIEAEAVKAADDAMDEHDYAQWDWASPGKRHLTDDKWDD